MKVTYVDPHDDLRRKLYRQFVKAGDLVFNVGANVGTRTEIFADLRAKVFALEPQPELVKRLRERFKDRENVMIIEAAAGPEMGTLDLMLFPESEGQAALATAEPLWIESIQEKYCQNWPMEKWTGKITARQITLDSLIGFYGVPDFIKIDVDGYEGAVLTGLSQKVPALCFEVTIPYGEPAVLCVQDAAERLGYTQFNYVVQEEAVLVLREWADAGTMMRILRRLPHRPFFCDVFAR